MSWTYDWWGNRTIKSMQFPVAESYEYDPSNKRIWKTNGSGEVFTLWGGRGERIGRYVPEVQQRTVDGVVTHKFVMVRQGWEDVYFGGKRLQPTDRLGSVGGGGRYYPYGEERTPTAEGADKFATYHRDASGFDYADQRYYSAKYGRFLTSDPYEASGGRSNPISFNRYLYSEGEPVGKYDPRGLLALEPILNIEYCPACHLTGVVALMTLPDGLDDQESSAQEKEERIGRERERRTMANIKVGIAAATAAVMQSSACRSIFSGSKYSFTQLVDHFFYGTALPGVSGRVGSVDYQHRDGAGAVFSGDRSTARDGRFGKGKIIFRPSLVSAESSGVYVMFFAEAIIHELGHAVNLLAGFGTSTIEFDVNADGSSNGPAQQRNDQRTAPCRDAIADWWKSNAFDLYNALLQ